MVTCATGSDSEGEQEVGAVGTFALPPDLGHGLAEVHVDAAVVDQHVVHLEEGLLTVLLLGAPHQDTVIIVAPMYRS